MLCVQLTPDFPTKVSPWCQLEAPATCRTLSQSCLQKRTGTVSPPQSHQPSCATVLPALLCRGPPLRTPPSPKKSSSSPTPCAIQGQKKGAKLLPTPAATWLLTAGAIKRFHSHQAHLPWSLWHKSSRMLESC